MIIAGADVYVITTRLGPDPDAAWASPQRDKVKTVRIDGKLILRGRQGCWKPVGDGEYEPVREQQRAKGWMMGSTRVYLMSPEVNARVRAAIAKYDRKALWRRLCRELVEWSGDPDNEMVAEAVALVKKVRGECS